MNKESSPESDGISISNIGTLDLRKTSMETIDSIDSIGNVGLLLYSRESVAAMSRVTGLIGNLGWTLEAPATAEVNQQQTEFTRDYFNNRQSPLQLIVFGRVIVNPDVPADEIDNGLSDLWITGDLVCPDHLLGVVLSKTRHLKGKTISYDKDDRLAIGNLTMDEMYLRALGDDTSLVVVGNLRMPEIVSATLLNQKLSKIRVTGKILMCEENAGDIMQRMVDDQHVTRISTIPSGHLLMDSEIILDSSLLASLPSKKIFCSRMVQIDPGTDSAALNEGLESLYCTDVVICPADLADIVRRKCPDPTTKVLTYEGELWSFSGVTELAASRFEYLAGDSKAALLVKGVLEISPDIPAAVLADRLSVVYHTGVIQCSEEQLGAIQARLGTSTGVLTSSNSGSIKPSKRHRTNAGYLAL